MAKDPVCGMDVQPGQTDGQSQYQGQTYYFCSAECKQRFDQKPDQYIRQQRRTA